MTIETKIKSMLVNCGLFEDMAEKVLQAVKDDPVNDVMRGRWHDDESAYPSTIMALTWFSARQHAVKIIDRDCPKHWAREVFAERA